MTFLDKLPQDWSRPELNELRDLLVLAYPHSMDAEMLAMDVGLAPGTFPIQQNMRASWTALIVELGNQGKLRLLVEHAAEDPRVAAVHSRLEEMLGGRPAVATPQPVPGPGWWRGDDLEPAVASKLFPERLMERRSRLLQIALAAWVTAAAQSVAKLSLRFGAARAHGTGFLIGDDLLLTNHHNVVHEEYGPVTSVDVEFDYQEQFVGTPLVRKGLVDSIMGVPKDDWAVIRLAKAADRPPLRLGTPFDVGVDDTVVVIQHPNGAYKQFALEPLGIRYVDDERVQYVADTQQGSSGSPVFSTRMHVVALHHAEAETTVDVDGRTETVWRNQGINIGRVMSGLKDHEIAFLVNE
jgi:Trypsin-like peptidase domain/Effector-associated domain 1